MPIFDDIPPGGIPDWSPAGGPTDPNAGKATRADLAVDCQIGALTFTAVGCSGGGERRLAAHGGIGVDGEIYEDLGEGARSDTIQAELYEWQWLELEKIRREAKVVTIVHPLFGAYQGRVASTRYTAGLADMVDVQIVVVEDGDHTVMMTPQVVTLPGAAQAARSAAGAFDDLGIEDQLADIDDISDVTDAYDALMGDGGAWDTFESILDLADEGAAAAQELGAGLADLASAGADVISAVEDSVRSASELVQTGLVDATYGLIDAARATVEAARAEAGEIWQEYVAPGPASIAALAREWLGTDDDDAIDAILAGNPQIIDLGVLPRGMGIMRPVR